MNELKYRHTPLVPFRRVPSDCIERIGWLTALVLLALRSTVFFLEAARIVQPEIDIPASAWAASETSMQTPAASRSTCFARRTCATP